MRAVRFIYDLVIYLFTGRVLPSLVSPSIILSFLIIQSIQNLQIIPIILSFLIIQSIQNRQIIPIILSVQRGSKFLILNS